MSRVELEYGYSWYLAINCASSADTFHPHRVGDCYLLLLHVIIYLSRGFSTFVETVRSGEIRVVYSPVSTQIVKLICVSGLPTLVIVSYVAFIMLVYVKVETKY